MNEKWQCKWYLGEHFACGWGETKQDAMWNAIHEMLRWIRKRDVDMEDLENRFVIEKDRTQHGRTN